MGNSSSTLAPGVQPDTATDVLAAARAERTAADHAEAQRPRLATPDT
jgi:hypothetical protein